MRRRAFDAHCDFFPVISVTDDLVILQNPAELDCCARRQIGTGHFCVRSAPPAIILMYGASYTT